MTNLRITSLDLQRLYVALELESHASALQFKRRVRQAVQPVKKSMEESAVQARMLKASRAVGVRQSYAGKSATIKLVVSNKKAPNARPLDRPNRGEFNRHPVFPNSRLSRAKWNWTDQPARRFFTRGALVGGEKATHELYELLEDYIKGVVK